ncbi:zinc finger HIT domain-containing protein 2 isoform X2 [Tanacetum coccineum]
MHPQELPHYTKRKPEKQGVDKTQGVQISFDDLSTEEKKHFQRVVASGELNWESDPVGSTTVVLSISSVLCHNSQPENVSEALSYCLEQTCSPAFRHMGGLQFGLGILEDVVKSLLSLGGDGLVCGLCDLHRMIKAGMKEPQEAWSSLAGLVTVEKNAAMDYKGNAVTNVGVYLPDFVFSLDRLYLALSRGISRTTTKIYSVFLSFVTHIGDKKMVAAATADSPEQAAAIAAEKLAAAACVFIICMPYLRSC